MDSFLGVTGAGPTWSGSFGGQKWWAVACFGPQPPGFFWPRIDLEYKSQPVLAMLYVGEGEMGSWMEINWRQDGGIRTLRQTITLGAKPNATPFPFQDTFFGYAETMRDSAVGIKLGRPTKAETDAVRTWGSQYLKVQQ